MPGTKPHPQGEDVHIWPHPRGHRVSWAMWVHMPDAPLELTENHATVAADEASFELCG